MNSEEKNVQLIFVVETTETAKTDTFYIKGVLDEYYNVNNNKITFVYLGGKYNYKKNRPQNDIKKYIKDYKHFSYGDSYVIYVLDKDKGEKSEDDAKYILEIEDYCKDNDYEIIWFVRDIEDVFWGYRVTSRRKKEAAYLFSRQLQIKNVEKRNLSAPNNVNKRPKSNILTILNEYLETKS
jgi:hypothetical protein